MLVTNIFYMIGFATSILISNLAVITITLRTILFPSMLFAGFFASIDNIALIALAW